MDNTKLCPFCAEEIKTAAIKCKHCGSVLEDDTPPESTTSEPFQQPPIQPTKQSPDKKKMELPFDKEQIIGVMGSILIFIGLVKPYIVSSSLTFNNFGEEMEGTCILIFAIASIILIIIKKYRYLLAPGILSLLFTGYSYMVIKDRLIQEGVYDTFHMGSAWVFLLIGGILIVTVGASGLFNLTATHGETNELPKPAQKTDPKYEYSIVLKGIEDEKAYHPFGRHLNTILKIPFPEMKTFIVPGKVLYSHQDEATARAKMEELSMPGITLDLSEAEISDQFQRPTELRRIACILLNLIIVSILAILTTVILVFVLIAIGVTSSSRSANSDLWMGILVIVVMVSICITYFTVMHGSRGQTFGKMFGKIKVVNIDGSPIDRKTAFLRAIYFLVPYATGYYVLADIISVWLDRDQQKTIHDRLAKTRVIMADKD